MPSRKELANAIRFLSMDAVQQANSGHPGAPMGMADFAEVLWRDFMKHNPANPAWADRDRFVLSNGHASMLLYSVLHLTGYDLSLDDLKNFRQMGSCTPGHPECKEVPGVETTTGPLGQGIANGVGMAVAEKLLAERFNREGFNLVDHYTYVAMGDGCMMEGVSHEACSLAGTLGLGKLIALYDDNDISIDGKVGGWFSEDTAARYEAYGWQVIRGVDGHDAEAVAKALTQAKEETDKPSLICLKTCIACGSPNKGGSNKSHGSPLGAEEIALTRKALGWEYGPFEIPADIRQAWDAKEKGAKAEAEWNALLAEYQAKHPDLAAEFIRRMKGDLPEDWAAKAQAFVEEAQAREDQLATRKASLASIEGYAPMLPELFGGSADLTPSNGTFWSGSMAVNKQDGSQDMDWSGNYLFYGVREFAMAAIMNGLTLHGGFIPYGGTFLVFSDYMRNGMRMASLMGLRSIFVLTHDSIGVGEDGPTHQPVEHVSSLRLIPNMRVWRPCDLAESAVAWKISLESKENPASLCFTRQTTVRMDRDAETLANMAKGGYVLKDCQGAPQAIILASGSEVGIAAEAADALSAKGVNVRLVSMPCMELFEEQDQAYKDSVLPPEVKCRVAVEAGVGHVWYKYIGKCGQMVGMTGFGASAPGAELFRHFGFTTENVVKAVETVLQG